MSLMETFVHCLPFIGTGSVLAMAVANKPETDLIEEGQYVIPNSWKEGKQRLQFLSEIFDEESQRRIKPLLKPGGTCLEVGPGIGSMTRFLAENTGADGKIIALDIDDTFLPEVAATSPQISTIQGDITTYDAGVEQFDFIYMRAVFMHLTRNDNPALVKRLVRALKPGGYLYIEDVVAVDNRGRFWELAKIDSQLVDYVEAMYERFSGYMSFEQGYKVADMMSAAGLANVNTNILSQRVQGGETANGFFMQLTCRQLEPYLREIANHDTLFPMLQNAWLNPDIHWFEHARCFSVGQRS